MKNTITNQCFDEERALYNIKDTKLVNVKFEGPLDGESALKEMSGCDLFECNFSLRYPLWHCSNFNLNTSYFTNTSRAPLWYCKEALISACHIEGTKAIRECTKVNIENSVILSDEFGWKCNDIKLTNSEVQSSYLFFDSSNIVLNNITMKGKYSFQYMKNLTITNSNLDTKDAFWHSENVYVKNTTLKGEYLGWYSKNVTLENCKIIGTQPLCYCENLKLINCEMIDTDQSFEYSSVVASIIGKVDSIKNPKEGVIECDEVDEVILSNSIYESFAKIIERNKKNEKLVS